MRDFKFRCDHCGKILDEMHDYTEAEIDLPVGWWQNNLTFSVVLIPFYLQKYHYNDSFCVINCNT